MSTKTYYPPSGNLVGDINGILYSKNGVPPVGLKPIVRPVSLIFYVSDVKARRDPDSFIAAHCGTVVSER